MEKDKKPVTPWFLLEIAAQLLSDEDFAAYCKEHPEEVQAARETLFKPPYSPN